MKLNTLLMAGVLCFPMLAQAAMIDLIQLPGYPVDEWEIFHAADSRGYPMIAGDSRGYPILQFWFKNGDGKVESNLFVDLEGTGTLPSAAIYYVDNWKKELPDIHYRVIGTYYPGARLGPSPTPQGVPLPGAGLLFGSALVAGALLKERRKTATLA